MKLKGQHREVTPGERVRFEKHKKRVAKMVKQIKEDKGLREKIKMETKKQKIDRLKTEVELLGVSETELNKRYEIEKEIADLEMEDE